MPRNYEKESAWEREKYTIIKLKFNKGDPLLEAIKKDADSKGLYLSTRIKEILKLWLDPDDDSDF